EVAMHQAEPQGGGKHELFLICDDVHAFVEKMASHSVACEPTAERGWGTISSITLPSGLKLGVYEAHHARPAAKKKAAKAVRDVARSVRKATKKSKKAARQRER